MLVSLNRLTKNGILGIGYCCVVMLFLLQGRGYPENITEDANVHELKDKHIFDEKIRLSHRQNLDQENISSVVMSIGKSFIGSKYRPHTLETPCEEHLITNLREFDCVTFIETTLALARTIKSGNPTFSGFKGKLKKLRYRWGIIDHYPSRLHYFTDWILDNQKRSTVRDITRDIGGIPCNKTINYMSTHRERYPALADKSFLAAIKKREAVLSHLPRYYIPKQRINQVLQKIQHGDIVAIIAPTEGLDVSHVGFVYREGRNLFFLHASTKEGAVRVSDTTLANYVAEGGYDGIVVARPIDIR